MGEQWVINMKEELQSWRSETEARKWGIRCIYRVPKKIRDLNPDAYSPSIVSLGPYHHGQGHLKLMEPHKRRAVFGFLCRSGRSLADVVDAMREHVSVMMEAYEDLEEPWTDENRFLELMVLDACFLVEMLTSLYELDRDELDRENPYDDNDPVFNNSLVLSSLWVDIFKLENQLPMGALSTLMQLPDKDVANHFQECFVFEECPAKNISAYHILDLQRQLRGYDGKYWYSGGEPNRKTATELLQSGVHFRKSKTRCFKDITFKDGILSIPTFQFQHDTEAWLLNLLAFEHVHGPTDNCGINSYVLLMDSLVNTAKDVEVLREKEIITGLLGNDEEIARIYNRLGRGFELLYYEADENMDFDVNAKITKYCRRPLNRWRASFLHTYFTNPWVFFSLLGALVLLVLTILQTVYAMISYYKS